jgi:hypothetical protein
MGTIGTSEMSGLDQLTLRNNPEDVRIQDEVKVEINDENFLM